MSKNKEKKNSEQKNAHNTHNEPQTTAERRPEAENSTAGKNDRCGKK